MTKPIGRPGRLGSPRAPAGASLWTTHDTPRPGREARHDLGRSTLLVRAGDGGSTLSLALASGAGRAARAAEADWSTTLTGEAPSYELRPTYPAIPVCVRLATPLVLPPGAMAEGWIRSTLDVELSVAGRAMAVFQPDPVFKTLYGKTNAGIVCRFGSSELVLSDDPPDPPADASPVSVLHPVRVRNVSDGPVRVGDLCLYGDQLSVYSLGGTLRSERVSFAFSESGVRMSVDGHSRPPRDWTCLVKPRVSGEEAALDRSIELFRAITRM